MNTATTLMACTCANTTGSSLSCGAGTIDNPTLLRLSRDCWEDDLWQGREPPLAPSLPLPRSLPHLSTVLHPSLPPSPSSLFTRLLFCQAASHTQPLTDAFPLYFYFPHFPESITRFSQHIRLQLNTFWILLSAFYSNISITLFHKICYDIEFKYFHMIIVFFFIKSS